MTYKAVMVIADATDSCERRVNLAAQLARDCGAALLGVAAETISANYFGAIGEAGYIAGELIESQQSLLEEDLRTAERHFRSATGGLQAEWLSLGGPTLSVITQETCRADLVVAGRRSGDSFDFNRGSGAADLLLLSGRPVLVAPPEQDRLDTRTLMVAWKDTREARRAVADALPLLQQAQQVIVAAAGEGADDAEPDPSLGRISDYLGRHGVAAVIERVSDDGEDVGSRLVRAAQGFGAELVVAGAYGHSRAREWAFGGVTEHLIRHSPVASLMSH